MSKFLILTHPIFATILFVGYLWLALRFFRKKNDKADALDKSLAQIVRIVLLLLYLSGLLLSINLHLYVNRLHHYASLLPVVVLFSFQFLPSLFKKEATVKAYAWMFFFMFLIIIIVALSSRISFFI